MTSAERGRQGVLVSTDGFARTQLALEREPAGSIGQTGDQFAEISFQIVSTSSAPRSLHDGHSGNDLPASIRIEDSRARFLQVTH